MSPTAVASPPPAVPPAPPDVPLAPRAVLRAVAVVGAAAAVLVPVAAPGIGVPLLGIVAAGALLPLARRPRARGWRSLCLGTALLLLAAAAVRDARWLVALDVAAAGALLSLALLPWRSWPGVLHGTVALPLAAAPAAGWVTAGARRAAERTRWQAAAPALRGAALAAALLLVFVPLLVSADAAFADLLGRLVPGLPDEGAVLGRGLALVVGALAAAAAAHVLRHPPVELTVPAPARVLRGTSEWLLPLGSLVALLTAFVLLQGRVLFGGHEHVLSRTGLTYAEYTRSGFWQLLAVTALVLAVVAAAARWTPRGRGERLLLGALCLLALVIDASALSRLSLYVDEYGLTRLRILVAATCVWLAVVLLAVLAAGAHRSGGRWLPRAVVLSAAAVLLALTAADPDARIARAALERGERADLTYLSGLSADAIPVLVELPPATRACVLAGVAQRLADDPWTSWNAARSQARDVLRGVPLDPGCLGVGPR